MAKGKFEVVIKSDGTAEGTSLMVNGVDITKSGNVTNVYFNVYNDGYVSVSWSLQTDEKDGTKRTETFSYNPNSDKPITKKIKKVQIGKSVGDSAPIQFADLQDETEYKVLKKVRNLDPKDIEVIE